MKKTKQIKRTLQLSGETIRIVNLLESHELQHVVGGNTGPECSKNNDCPRPQ